MAERLTPVGDCFGLQKYDVLGRLLKQPAFWEAVDKVNFCSNALDDEAGIDDTADEKVVSKIIDLEDDALCALAAELGIDFSDQPVDIVGEGYLKSNDGFKNKGLIAIKNGELGDLCSIPSEEPLYLESDAGVYVYREKHNLAGIEVFKDGQTYAFAFNKKTLAAFELWDAPETDLPEHIVDLQKIAFSVRASVNSPDFYELSPCEQADFLNDELSVMNQRLELHHNSEAFYYNIAARHYYNLIEQAGSKPKITEQFSDEAILLNYQNCKVVVPELLEKTGFKSPADFPISRGEPMLLLSNPGSKRSALVAFGDMTMYETCHADFTGPKDLLELLGESRIQDALQLFCSQAENCNSLEEIEKIRDRLDDDINRLVGVNIEEKDLFFSGIIYTPEPGGDHSSHFIRDHYVNSTGYNVLYILDKWQVVLTVEYSVDGQSWENTKIGYIIPRSPHCISLELLEESDADNPDD